MFSTNKIFICVWQKTWMHDIRSMCNKKYLYLTHNCKLNMKNENFR
jgi:hypothetical protein